MKLYRKLFLLLCFVFFLLFYHFFLFLFLHQNRFLTATILHQFITIFFFNSSIFLLLFINFTIIWLIVMQNMEIFISNGWPIDWLLCIHEFLLKGLIVISFSMSHHHQSGKDILTNLFHLSLTHSHACLLWKFSCKLKRSGRLSVMCVYMQLEI